MAQNTFIGVYFTSELPSALGATVRPMVKRKRQWFVWVMPDGAYLVQPLNAIQQPMAEPHIVTSKEFNDRFTHDPNCLAMPSTEPALNIFADLNLAVQPPPLPVPGDSYPGYTLDFGGPTGTLKANDPDLLLSWVQAGVPLPHDARGEDFSPVQEAELARIVTDSGHTELPANIFSGDMESLFDDRRQSPEDKEKEFRAEFAMALMNIKNGSRDEGMAQLAILIDKRGMDFEGAAALFSELGLNLRRLGLVKLALRAHLRALDLAPQDERVHFNLARTYHDLNDIATAKSHLQKALVISPAFAAAKQFLGFLASDE